jgi:hypothetical protein
MGVEEMQIPDRLILEDTHRHGGEVGCGIGEEQAGAGLTNVSKYNI